MSDDRQVVRHHIEGVESSTPSIDSLDPEIDETPLTSATIGALVTSLQSVMLSYSGPMPPPSDFEAYEQVLSGTALVIRESWVNEQNHRRQMEDREMVLREEGQSESIRLASRGQIIATVLGLGILGLCFYMIYRDAFSQAAAIAIGSLVAFAIAFYTGHLPWLSRKDK